MTSYLSQVYQAGFGTNAYKAGCRRVIGPVPRRTLDIQIVNKITILKICSIVQFYFAVGGLLFLGFIEQHNPRWGKLIQLMMITAVF